MGGRAGTAIVAAASVLIALTACSSPPARLPSGVEVNVKQYRSDYEVRRLQLEVINRGKAPITITAATFRSERFTAPIAWHGRPTEVPAGITRDLPVVLPAARCSAAADSPSRVSLSFTLPDGGHGRHTVRATDTLGDVARVTGQDCLEEAVDRIARVEATALGVTGDGPHSVAHLTVSISPTGSGGAFTLERVAGTVLLQPVSGQDWPIGETVSGTSPAGTVILDIVPNRCDAHAIGEDKVGTLLPVHVSTPTVADGRFTLPLDGTIRDRLKDFVARHCGFGS